MPVWPVRRRQRLMDAEKLMEQIVIQTSCDSRKSILVGWHHLPTRPASSVSRQQQKLCWWDTAEPPASICLSFISSACPSCLLSVLHVFLPKLNKSFHEILTTVCHSNCMLSSKTSTDSKHTGGLGRVRLSTVALPSRGQQVDRDILSHVISLFKWPIYAKSLGLLMSGLACAAVQFYLLPVSLCLHSAFHWLYGLEFFVNHH